MRQAKTPLVALLVTILFGATSTWAQSWGKSANSDPALVWGDRSNQVSPDVASGAVESYSGNLKLTQVNNFGGPCPDAYANQCVDVGCECFEFAGSGSGSVFGKVTSGNAFLELTVDLTDFAGDPDGGCLPTFGALGIMGSKDDEVLDLSGTSCGSFGSGLAFIGGFDFNMSSTTTCDGGGTANFSSSLTLKGKARKLPC